jgi:hypothetical protein
MKTAKNPVVTLTRFLHANRFPLRSKTLSIIQLHHPGIDPIASDRSPRLASSIT